MLWSEGVAIPNENIPHTLTQCREGVALDLHKVTLQDRTQEWESVIWNLEEHCTDQDWNNSN